MGGYPQTDLGSLVITVASDNDHSDAMDFRGWRGLARGIGIYGPGTLDSTVKVQVSEDGINWFDLQSNGADVTVPADGHVVVKAVTWKYLRLSGLNETVNRTFIIKAEAMN